MHRNSVNSSCPQANSAFFIRMSSYNKVFSRCRMVLSEIKSVQTNFSFFFNSCSIKDCARWEGLREQSEKLDAKAVLLNSRILELIIHSAVFVNFNKVISSNQNQRLYYIMQRGISKLCFFFNICSSFLIFLQFHSRVKYKVFFYSRLCLFFNIHLKNRISFPNIMIQ